VDVYKNTLLQQNEVMSFNEKIRDCLNAFEYLYSIIIDDKNLKIGVIENIIQEIDNLKLDKSYRYGNALQNGHPIQRLYKLNATTRNTLISKKARYSNELTALKSGVEYNEKIDTTSSNNKKTGILNSLNDSLDRIADRISKWDIVKVFSGKKIIQIILDIFCYLFMIFWGLFLLINLFSGGIFATILCLIVILIFAPPIKKIIVKKLSNKIRKIGVLIILIRIVLTVVSFWTTVYHISQIPYSYEGVWESKDGMVVELQHNQDANIKLIDGTNLKGKYTTEGSSSNYTITVKINNSNDIKEMVFKYEEDNKNIEFYMVEDNKPSIYFTLSEPSR